MVTVKASILHGIWPALFLEMLVFAGISLSLLGCGASPPTPDTPERALVVVVIDSTPAEVKLFVDGAFYGDASEWIDHAVPIPSGLRRLELRAEGFYPHRRDANLEFGRSYTLHVNLVPRLE